MKVLLISPEVSPLSKTGGLGDVAGALPQALRDLGLDVRVLCPLYGDFEQDFLDATSPIDPLRVRIGGRFRKAAVREGVLPGTEVPVYLLEHKSSFGRSGIYAGPKGDFPDNAERFLLLTGSALTLPEAIEWMPDVLHVHDWTVALIPAFLNALPAKDPRRKWASVLTIHNLMHQGTFPSETFEKTGLPSSYYHTDGLEQDGCLNMLKGGIHHATKITTVSPSYAREIQESPFSHGLGPALRHRAADLLGIVNGIDCEKWDPQSDPSLPCNYSVEQVDEGKSSCKAALLEELSLPPDIERPLFFVVSRLDHQKGLDLLANVLPRLIKDHDMAFALLGNGDPHLENTFRKLASEHPKRIAAVIGFDESLARKLFAGGDFLVVPSRFEPCGLTQLYAMRFGTVPVVRRTGGLSDTVIPWAKGARGATGIVYDGEGEWELLLAIEQALQVFGNAKEFGKLRRAGMKRDSSWGPSANAYAQTYSWAVEARAEQA